MTTVWPFPSAVTGPEIKTHNLYFILPFLSCAVGCPPQETFSQLAPRSVGFPSRLNGFESFESSYERKLGSHVLQTNVSLYATPCIVTIPLRNTGP